MLNGMGHCYMPLGGYGGSCPSDAVQCPFLGPVSAPSTSTANTAADCADKKSAYKCQKKLSKGHCSCVGKIKKKQRRKCKKARRKCKATCNAC